MLQQHLSFTFTPPVWVLRRAVMWIKQTAKLMGIQWLSLSRCATAGELKFNSCGCLIVVTRPRTQYNSTQLTMQPLESNFRSDMQRKLRLQPPLSFVQSLTGPKESRRTSRESKEELIISSSLSKEQVTKESQFHS